MALSPRLITDNTPVAAAVLLVLLLGSAWAIVELAPERERLEIDDRPELDLPVPHAAKATHHELEVAFHPNERPTDPELCDWTAEQVFHHFRPLMNGQRVTFHTRGIAGLVGAYIDLGCPAAIHDGDWETATQLLGVAMIYETLEPQAEVYAPGLEWDARAADLLPTATSTYNVLSPYEACSRALRQDRLRNDEEANEMTLLMSSCLQAFE